jgi:hypothetical protein
MAQVWDIRFITGDPNKDIIIELQDDLHTFAYKDSDGTYITYGNDLKPDRRFRLIKSKKIAKQINL